MRVTALFARSRAIRIVLFVFVFALALIAAAVGWVRGGALAGLLISAVSVFALVMAKSVLEIESDTYQILNKIRAVESMAGDQVGFNEAVLDRVRAVESKAGDQVGFNEAVLDRVRAVESKAGDQVGFNEAVLDRVRAVESRVRAVERKAGDQVGFNSAVLKRVRVLESRAQAVTPTLPGLPRRIERLRELIQAAQRAIEGSGTPIIHDEDHESAEPARSPFHRLDPVAAAGPAVSVIVPCFNDEGYVGDALESIRRQSVTDWECIVVDDGSTDRSVNEIEKAILGDTRFRLERHLKNLGVSAARNSGLDLASGRYVVFHDSDDLMMARSIEDRLRAVDREADPDIAGVFCGVRLADDGVSLDDIPDFEPWRPAKHFADFVNSAGECPFPLTAALSRVDVIREHGGFAEEMTVAEDWDLWFRIMRSGYYFVSSELRTVIYRQSTSSTAQARALAHVEASNELINAAHDAVSLPGSSRATTAYPFPMSLSHYQQLLARSKRAIQYAATTLLRGDFDTTLAILETLDNGSWVLLRRHLDINEVTSDGFRRASGLDAIEMQDVEDELLPLRRIFRSAIIRASE